MAARLEQDAKRRAEKKPAPVVETSQPRSAQEVKEYIDELFIEIFTAKFVRFVMESTQAASLLPHLLLPAEARGVALWDKAVESLGRSAGVLEELAESTAEAIARISARGDRIDRIQNETRALLNALVASEADA